VLEIIGLVIAVTAITALARGRGASPVIAGTVAVLGWVLLRFGALLFVRGESAPFVLLLASWAWIAAVAGFVRFVVGGGKPKPDSKWYCPNCRYLNNASSIICKACQQPWQSNDMASKNDSQTASLSK